MVDRLQDLFLRFDMFNLLQPDDLTLLQALKSQRLCLHRLTLVLNESYPPKCACAECAQEFEVIKVELPQLLPAQPCSLIIVTVATVLLLICQGGAVLGFRLFPLRREHLELPLELLLLLLQALGLLLLLIIDLRLVFSLVVMLRQLFEGRLLVYGVLLYPILLIHPIFVLDHVSLLLDMRGPLICGGILILRGLPLLLVIGVCSRGGSLLSASTRSWV